MDEIEKSILIFKEISRLKEAHAQIKTLIDKMFDLYLGSRDEDCLTQIIDWFECNSNHSIFSTTVEMIRYRTILDIIKQERLHSKTPFGDNVMSSKALINKYVRTTLLLRRVDLDLEEDLLEEVYKYIKDNNVSSIAINMILEKEQYIRPNYIKESLSKFEEKYR